MWAYPTTGGPRGLKGPVDRGLGSKHCVHSGGRLPPGGRGTALGGHPFGYIRLLVGLQGPGLP